MNPGKNTPSGEQLLAFIERVERLRENKKAISDDESAVFAEAKANGFDTKTIRRLIKRRAMDKTAREEADALLDIYSHAIGIEEAPLFRAAGLMGVDRTARDAVTNALKGLVPEDGDIIIRAFGAPIRLWRDADGEVQAEDWREPEPASPAAPSAPAKPQAPPPPECSEDEAEDFGAEAARSGAKVIENPFPASDKRRPRWDKGWRRENGGDGMGPAPKKAGGGK